jgi:hypothetical protein
MKDTFKKILVTFLLLVVMNLSFFSVAEARTVRVRGYYKPSTGRYVMPSYRTSPNRTKIDNWSTKGNYNPYTGKKGYKNLWGW